MLSSIDAVVQSAAVTADKLLYSYAIELVASLYTVSKKTVQTYFLSELSQISTDCENFWHRDSKENKLF